MGAHCGIISAGPPELIFSALPLMKHFHIATGAMTSVLDQVGRSAVAAEVSSPAAADGTTEAAAQDLTLWPGVSKRVLLHASTVRCSQNPLLLTHAALDHISVGYLLDACCS